MDWQRSLLIGAMLVVLYMLFLEWNTFEEAHKPQVDSSMVEALVSDPDILLLDEPTNHLDIPAIEWLEQALQQFRGALILVTHDRAFLQQVANQIAELDRGALQAAPRAGLRPDAPFD